MIPHALAGSALLGLLVVATGWADENVTQPGPAESMLATSTGDKPLDLLLTQAELRSIVRRYEPNTCVTFECPVDEDEVVVKARGVLAPMRDVSQDAWGGIAAPFWAILHPKDAWRILVPVPPKDRK